jgi:hypothetical protein
MARRNDEMDLAPALAGMLAALGEAAGYAGGGLRTTGVRAGRAGARVGRRTWDGARRAGERAPVAYRVFRGADPPAVTRRRPVEFLGIAAVAGATGAIAVLAIQRFQARAAAEETRADETRADETRADAATPAAEGSGDATAAAADPAKSGDAAADTSVSRIAERQEARTAARTTARSTTR